MKTEISFSAPSQIETECLVAVVLDRSQNGKSNPSLETSDKAVAAAAADLLATGEVSGKMFETTMVHRPQGLKAKRLLLVGGGKADNFSGYELRKLAGAAVRFLKPKSIRQFAFIAPENWSGQADPAAHSTYVFERGGAPEAVKAIAEGAFVGHRKRLRNGEMDGSGNRHRPPSGRIAPAPGGSTTHEVTMGSSDCAGARWRL